MESCDVQRTVIEVVARLGVDLGHLTVQVELDTSLLDAIGLDSLSFVDLTVELEDALGIKTFPMQEWVDAQRELDRPRQFTVGNLVDECLHLLAP